MKIKKSIAGILLIMLLTTLNIFSVSAGIGNNFDLYIASPENVKGYDENGDVLPEADAVKYTIYGDFSKSNIIAFDESGNKIQTEDLTSVSYEFLTDIKSSQSQKATRARYAVVDLSYRDYKGSSITVRVPDPFTKIYDYYKFDYVSFTGGYYYYQHIFYE